MLTPIVAVSGGIGALGREDGSPSAHAVFHPQVAILRIDAAALCGEGCHTGDIHIGIGVWTREVVSMGLRKFLLGLEEEQMR